MGDTQDKLEGKLQQNQYHEVFVVLPDVFKAAGPEVFKHLIRKEVEESDDSDEELMPGREVPSNLLVLNERTIDLLVQKDGHNDGYAAREVLEFLSKGTGKWETSEEGYAVWKRYDGLHIALVHDKSELSDLVKKIRSIWKESEMPTILTADYEHHVRQGSKGMNVEKPQFLMVNADIVNEGIIEGNDDLLESLFDNDARSVPLEKAIARLGRNLYQNQFIHFPKKSTGQRKQLARVKADVVYKVGDDPEVTNRRVVLMSDAEYAHKIQVGNHTTKTRMLDGSVENSVFGIRPKDDRQYLAMRHGLLNPDIELMFLTGSQGSGKTLLAYACAMELILHYGKSEREQRGQSEAKGGFYNKLVLIKPTNIVGGKGRDPGALPGGLFQKLKPHLYPYIDAHNRCSLGSEMPFEQLLLHPDRSNDFGEPQDPQYSKKIKTRFGGYLPAHNEAIEIMHSGFARGRSIPNAVFIVDEAQNFTPYELKTLLERLDVGTKCIVLGDPYQTDNPSCTREYNGLTHAINHFIDETNSMLIRLQGNYRSEISKKTLDWKVYNT